jgi:hypothetical protein
MSRQIRQRKVHNGLVLANGGVLTYQHVICLSSKPRKDFADYPREKPLPEYVDVPVPKFVDQAEGAASIEVRFPHPKDASGNLANTSQTYTVEYNRKGVPRFGHIVGRLEENGHRFLANHGNDVTLARLADTALESVGLRGTVRKGEDGRNLFILQPDAKL